MGERKGWRVREDRDRYRAEVWLPKEQRYRSKTFDEVKEARAWAKYEAGGIATGKPSDAMVGPRRVLFADLAADYLARLKARGRSDSHLYNVKTTLAGAQKAAPNLLAPGVAQAIERWLDELDSEPATKNRRLAEVQGCLNWAVRQKRLVDNPLSAAETYTVPEKIKPQFTLSEMQHLLFVEHPYRAHFALMLLAGLRKSEAAAIAWEDLDLSGKMLWVRKHETHRLKRNKERLVPIQDELLLVLGEPSKGRIVRMGVGVNGTNTFRRFLNHADVPVGGRSPHSCRHSYAGLMTACGVPSNLLGLYMGHESNDTTLEYTQLAARYAQVVGHWQRGRFEILIGACSPIRRTAGLAAPAI